MNMRKDVIDSNLSKSSEEVLATVHSSPAKKLAYNTKKQRVSRRLLLAERAQHLTVNCPVSGITSLIQIPAIPGYTLIWSSPLASVENCRGMVQQGMVYLRRLDTQTLAGMLIVIAEDYNLFSYCPADSAAQKNAILRTAGKDTIINALLIIEDFVHSNNSLYLPKLSLKMDVSIEASGIEVIMTEWLKLVAAYIMNARHKENEDSKNPEDEFYSIAPKKTILPSYTKVEDKKAKQEAWQQTNKKWQEQRVLKEDIKTAKAILKTFTSDEIVSSKLMNLLRSVFTEESLITMDSSMRFLIASKMESFTSVAASKLVAILKKDFPLLRNELASLDSLDSEEADTIASEAEGQGYVEPTTTLTTIPLGDTIEPTSLETIEPITMQEEQEEQEESAVSVTFKPTKAMSIIEQIKARKQQAAKQLEDERKAKFATFAALSTITSTNKEEELS